MMRLEDTHFSNSSGHQNHLDLLETARFCSRIRTRVSYCLIKLPSRALATRHQAFLSSQSIALHIPSSLVARLVHLLVLLHLF